MLIPEYPVNFIELILHIMTRNLIITLLLLLGSSAAFGQYQYFEGDWNWLEVKIDSTLPGNRWMIGQPQKVIFDSAFSRPNAIVTDTMLPYPSGQRSVFQVRLPLEQYFAYPYFVLYFYHKIDADSLHAGGWIEASYDNGQTWTNIREDSTYRVTVLDQGMNSTLFNGKPGFTGTWNTWRTSAICWGYMSYFQPIPPRPEEIRLRFIYESDSLAPLTEGWMIDNMEFWIEVTHVLEELRDMSLTEYIEMYPNPIKDQMTLFYRIDSDSPVRIDFIDLSGRVIHSIPKGNLPKGVYFEYIEKDLLDRFPDLFFIQFEANGKVLNKKGMKVR